MFTVMCPSCNGLVRIKTEPRLGQFVTCPSCQKMTKVFSLHPLRLEVVSGSWGMNPVESAASPDKLSRRRQERFNRVDQNRDTDEEFELEEFGGVKRGKPGKRSHKSGKLRKPTFDDEFGY